MTELKRVKRATVEIFGSNLGNWPLFMKRCQDASLSRVIRD